MGLTVDQIIALAPDPASAAAGKKLSTAKEWRGLGQSQEALWGECQGSALYQVRVDLSDLTAKCSCPSRKFPCKHSLGLLLLAATVPTALPQSAPPPWVADWLAKRAADKQQKEARTTDKRAASAEADPVARAKRMDRRLTRVLAGLDGLDLWMNDLMRTGLAAVETQPATFWETQAARMVDAQAQGVAGRLRRMSSLPHSGPDWPDRLLGQMGRLALLTHAFRHLAALPAALQDDVRTAVGWTLDAAEVAARGERVVDDWAIVGQRVIDDERVRTQSTWLAGLRTGREALVLQFSAGGAPFAEALAPGTHQEAEVIYWPSAYPQRALLTARRGTPAVLTGSLPVTPSVEAFLRTVAGALGGQPWLERFLCLLGNVVPVHEDGAWWVRDAAGDALPLVMGTHWRLLARSAGLPIQLAGEWDGERLRPLGLVAEGAYHLLGAE